MVFVFFGREHMLTGLYAPVHDPDYRTSWKDWESFVESVTERISELDETIPELPPKDLVSLVYAQQRTAKQV